MAKECRAPVPAGDKCPAPPHHPNEIRRRGGDFTTAYVDVQTLTGVVPEGFVQVILRQQLCYVEQWQFMLRSGCCQPRVELLVALLGRVGGSTGGRATQNQPT